MNLYQLLNLPHNATEKQIRNQLSQSKLPSQHVVCIQEMLLNPQSRQKYDQRLREKNPEFFQAAASPSPQISPPKSAPAPQQKPSVTELVRKLWKYFTHLNDWLKFGTASQYPMPDALNQLFSTAQSHAQHSTQITDIQQEIHALNQTLEQFHDTQTNDHANLLLLNQNLEHQQTMIYGLKNNAVYPQQIHDIHTKLKNLSAQLDESQQKISQQENDLIELSLRYDPQIHALTERLDHQNAIIAQLQRAIQNPTTPISAIPIAQANPFPAPSRPNFPLSDDIEPVRVAYCAHLYYIHSMPATWIKECNLMNFQDLFKLVRWETPYLHDYLNHHHVMDIYKNGLKNDADIKQLISQDQDTWFPHLQDYLNASETQQYNRKIQGKQF